MRACTPTSPATTQPGGPSRPQAHEARSPPAQNAMKHEKTMPTAQASTMRKSASEDDICPPLLRASGPIGLDAARESTEAARTMFLSKRLGVTSDASAVRYCWWAIEDLNL